MEKIVSHRRHFDFEPYDHIEIKKVPRYKEGYLSGDEWRVSAVAKCYFKGMLVKTFTFRNIDRALHCLPGMLEVDLDNGIAQEVIDNEDKKCDQPGCYNDATTKVKLNKLTSSVGERLDPEMYENFIYYRQFCDKHQTRGDCGIEDQDSNYEPFVEDK